MLNPYPHTTSTIDKYITFSFPKQEEPNIPEPSIRNTTASLQLRFEEEIKSGKSQEIADSQTQLALHLFDDEDVLDWDVAITTPPPRPSGTIRVKLKYIGRSKPFPVENFWEE